MSPRSRPASRIRVVDLSVTSGSPQASQANWDSCSQHEVSPSASMITWTPPGPPLRTTAARSPQARGPRLRYRQAQRATDHDSATTALRLAVEADPAFKLALADLDAITGTSGRRHRRGQMNWERHHIEIVRTAASGNGKRAADLLREHLAAVGCDPLAFRSSPRCDSQRGWTTTSKASQANSQIATQPDGRALYDRPGRRHPRDRNCADRGQKRRLARGGDRQPPRPWVGVVGWPGWP